MYSMYKQNFNTSHLQYFANERYSCDQIPLQSYSFLQFSEWFKRDNTP